VEQDIEFITKINPKFICHLLHKKVLIYVFVIH